MARTDMKRVEPRLPAIGDEIPRTGGIVLHSPVLYDLTVWLAFLGKEHSFREKVLKLGRVACGESVLDVGCGTGTLAIAAKRRVGSAGTVHGLDASVEMLARAEKKAKKAGVEVFFKNGVAEAIPFPDAQFNVVLSTVMLHHLPQKARRWCANEIRRVLKPDGRVLVVDFEGFSDQKRTILSHFHRPHGHVRARDIVALLAEAGLKTIESGPLGIRDLQFVLAGDPCCSLTPSRTPRIE
jgi:2-polyprenyl-3-methyl-5-hydroxy-6-metoxy-1,4-benzoquinol methylase